MGVALQVPCEGGWSYVHSVFQSAGESTDLEGFLSLLCWCGFLEAQVPELVSDEVELTEGNLLAQLHFFRFVAEVEDNSHLKHNISL